MIIDAHDLDAGQVLECDLCVIGSGAAGISIARAFAGSKTEVCLLEAGGKDYSEESQAIYKGRIDGLSYDPLDICRLRYFGGTTQHWTGWSQPLRALDFKRKSWVPHSGWPIGLQDIDPYYRQAQTVLELGPYGYDEDDWTKHGFAALGVDREKLQQRFWQLSPPTRFADTYGHELETAANIRVVLNANVTDIEAEGTGNTIGAVRFRTFEGKAAKATARHYVLACGGIENARLLLVSDGVHKTGLGNQHDLVGRFFMAHPLAPAGVIVSADPQPILAALSSRNFAKATAIGSLSPSDVVQEREGILNAALFLDFVERPDSGIVAARNIKSDIAAGKFPDDFTVNVWRVVRDIDDVVGGMWSRYKDGTNAFSKDALPALKLSLEHAPSPRNRVVLIDERDALGLRRVTLDLHVTEQHQRTSRVMAETAGRELGRLGLGRLQLADWLRETGGGVSPELEWHYHHMGTTRMSDDPKTGVVDADCRVHGIDNFYIAGSSVFPTSGYANPTLTIVALALRLTDHLKQKLG